MSEGAIWIKWAQVSSRLTKFVLFKNNLIYSKLDEENHVITF